MHSQALCFQFQRGQMPDGRNGKLQGWHSSRASHSVLSCFFSRLPIPSQPQAQSCSFTTSSRGLAPPKIAEFGLATWLRGVATVRGLSWSRGRCALSSARQNSEVFRLLCKGQAALAWWRKNTCHSWRLNYTREKEFTFCWLSEVHGRSTKGRPISETTSATTSHWGTWWSSVSRASASTPASQEVIIFESWRRKMVNVRSTFHNAFI